MSAMSGGSREATKQSSNLQLHSLHTQSTQQALCTLQQLFASLHGPHGHTALLHNNSGGYVTASSSADRILQGLSVSQPILRLITTAVQAHVQKFSDGGTLTALFSLKLINSCLELAAPLKLVVEIHELLLQLCINLLSNYDCDIHKNDSCVKTLDISNAGQIVTVLRSILTSKPSCLLYGEDVLHVCHLLLKAFINSCSATQGPNIQYVCISGYSAAECELVQGLLFEAPQIPVYSTAPFNLPQVQNGRRQGQLKVALVSCSLAGDSEDFLDILYETSSHVTHSGLVLQQNTRFAEQVAGAGVSILACQKVVHPTVKRNLREAGLMVIDRLGAVMFKALHELAGGMIIGTVQSGFDSSQCGHLGDVCHRVIGDKSWHHLQGSVGDASVCTLLLKHYSEQAVEELKVQCKTGLHVLQMCLREPRMLCGGGCWQTWLAYHVYEEALNKQTCWSQELGCSESHLLLIINNFTHCLQSMATSVAGLDVKMSNSHHHLWAVADSIGNCQCGRYTAQSREDLMSLDQSRNLHTVGVDRRNESDGKIVSPVKAAVLDSFLVCVNALSTAVGVAGMVLSVDNIIEDTN